MCPPAHPSRPTEIGMDLSDQQIIVCFAKFSKGSNLPANVLYSPSLYQLAPADLLEERWYLAQSDGIKESSLGFWNAKGEATEIYSDDFVLIGTKTTLEYFDGKSPNGYKTDWQMYVYTVALQESLNRTKKKENRSLCRVFFLSEQREESATGFKEVTKQKPVANVRSDQDCKTETENDKVEVEKGDYLELNDLLEPPPFSSYDLDFFNEDDEKKKLDDDYFSEVFAEFLEGPVSSSESSGSLIRSLDEFFDSERLIEDHKEEVDKIESAAEGCSGFADVATMSSTSTEDGDRKGKKKKLKMFFCFMLY